MSIEHSSYFTPEPFSIEQGLVNRKATRQTFYRLLHAAVQGQVMYRERELPEEVLHAKSAFMEANLTMVESLRSLRREEICLAGRESHIFHFTDRVGEIVESHRFSTNAGYHSTSPWSLQGRFMIIGAEMEAADLPETASLLVSRGLGRVIDMQGASVPDRGWVVPLSSIGSIDKISCS